MVIFDMQPSVSCLAKVSERVVAPSTALCTKQTERGVEACRGTGTPASSIPQPCGRIILVRHLKMCATLSRSVPYFVVSDTYKLTAFAINGAPSSSVYYGEPDRSRVSCLDAMQVRESQLVILLCMSSASGPTGTKANAEGRQAAARLSSAFKLCAPNIQIAFPTCNMRHACVADGHNGRLERVCR